MQMYLNEHKQGQQTDTTKLCFKYIFINLKLKVVKTNKYKYIK